MIRRTEDGTAHFSGLQSCGSVWSCPVCAAKIRQHRADELDGGLGRWLDAGHGVTFVTFTLPHQWGDRLDVTFDAAEKAWRSVRNSRAWRAEMVRFGVRHYIRAIEVTVGANGWHPHVHVLILTRRPLDGRRVTMLGHRLFSRWAQAVRSRLGVECDRQAFRIEAGSRAAGRYVTKIQDDGAAHGLAMEMTRHDLKAGRRKGLTPMQLLDAVAAGDGDARRLWTEHERTTKGRRCLTWSRGCRDALGLDDERTDQEIAEAEVGGELVVSLDPPTWHRIAARPGADAAVLASIETGGLYALGLLLIELRR
ncbi:MAG: protein rep [Acidimicrobiia bacterium]